jgi:hypothetical protein
MKQYINIFILLLVTYLPIKLTAQELNCSVEVNATQVQSGTNVTVYDNLQKAIYQFMNNRKWTNDIFQNDERIECSILINITKQESQNKFTATLQIQSRRPVYNTSYYSPVISFKDDNFSFEYNEFERLEFNMNSFTSNLTSVLAYYAYLVIGFDYDTFSEKGGTEYFEKAQTIVNNAQSSSFPGWKSTESDDNRYWIVSLLLNGAYEDYHLALYKYHRLGLDIMQKDLDNGRKEIVESLRLMEKVHQRKFNNVILRIFFNAKVNELVEIFKKAPDDQKKEAYQILTKINATNSNQYNKIIKP